MKVITENKKAYFNYEILEKFEAGIVLIGQEVKSIKLGRINLAGAYVILREEEVFLVGANVPPYQPKNAPKNYNSKRARKLLLTKKEIKYLIGKSRQKGLTMIPLMIYTRKGKIKIEFGLGKGKRKIDKRESIKKREIEREIRRNIGREFH
ncbi:MAG: SsrA-binding protein SmpB [Patescibacteria group bacterium]|nr:SsrA-binding protein SmpB [Patescibacteria group bacterium]